MIETRDLVKSVDTSEGVLTILKGVSLKFEAGEAVAIVGASGSGKSTLLKLIGGILDCDQGKIEFKGNSIPSIPRKESIIILL